MSGPRVLYIGGTGRSGSTVLDSLLGCFPGVFSGGELAFLWQYGLVAHGKCSCGAPLESCPFWAEVLGRVSSTVAVDAERMVELRRRFRSAHLPLMFSRSFCERKLDALEEFPSVVELVYRSLADSSGATLIVDSSKEPHYSYILRERTGLPVYFLHLVRDPRAVGMSWRRSRTERGLDGGVQMERRGTLKSSLYYNVSNTAAELLWKKNSHYAFMRYEDFVDRPHEAVRRIGEFVGMELAVDDVLDAHRSFERVGQHSAWGNPNRFEHGRTTLRADEAWVDGLSRGRQFVLSACTAPLVHRYGYSFGTKRQSNRLPIASLRTNQIAEPRA
jgi:hypothetical protein